MVPNLRSISSRSLLCSSGLFGFGPSSAAISLRSLFSICRRVSPPPPAPSHWRRLRDIEEVRASIMRKLDAIDAARAREAAQEEDREEARGGSPFPLSQQIGRALSRDGAGPLRRRNGGNLAARAPFLLMQIKVVPVARRERRNRHGARR